MQGKVLADAARVHGDPRVLADDVALALGDLDVPRDRLEHTLPGDGRLALAGTGKRVSQVLWDVFQRPDVEMRGGVLDRVLDVGGDDAHAAFSAAVRPARRPNTVHSSSELPIIRFRPCVPPAISPH